MALSVNNILNKRDVKEQVLNLAGGKEPLPSFLPGFCAPFKLGHKVIVTGSDADRPVYLLYTCEIS